MSPAKMRSLYYSSTMGLLLHHHRLSSAVTAFVILFLALSSATVSPSASASSTTTPHHHSPTRLQLGRRLLLMVRRAGKSEEDQVRTTSGESLMVKQRVDRRRELVVRIGSSPPSCRSRCGTCTPCEPVRVTIPPGMSIPLVEYYPEVWRCKCGNHLYMPN